MTQNDSPEELRRRHLESELADLELKIERATNQLKSIDTYLAIMSDDEQKAMWTLDQGTDPNYCGDRIDVRAAARELASIRGGLEVMSEFRRQKARDLKMLEFRQRTLQQDRERLS